MESISAVKYDACTRECAVQKQKNQLSNCSLNSASRCMELSSYAHTLCGTTCHSHHTAPCHSKNQASCNCSTKCAQISTPAHFEGSPALTLGILRVSFFSKHLAKCCLSFCGSSVRVLGWSPTKRWYAHAMANKPQSYI